MVVWTRMVEVGGKFWRNSQQDLIELRERREELKGVAPESRWRAAFSNTQRVFL